NIGSTFYLGPYFNLLPIIAVSFMFVQQKLFTPPPTDEQQRMQQSMFKYMMIFMGFIFYKVAAGLCIYFITSSLWGLAERKLLPKKKVAPTLATETVNGPPAAGQAQRGKRRARREGPKVEEPPGTLQKLKKLWAEILKQAE